MGSVRFLETCSYNRVWGREVHRERKREGERERERERERDRKRAIETEIR